MNRSYDDWMQWLLHQLPMYQKIGHKALRPTTRHTELLSSALGHPHQTFKSIHVAGTNGKGTVCHLLASLFLYHGIKAGLLTSPHYVDFRERIRIGGKKVSKALLVKGLDKIFPHAKKMDPSFFEISTVLGFWAFRKSGCEYGIIETGMGGRLDSTNIITPVLSIITRIDLDHTKSLGETVERIAVEKGGIIKQGIPVVAGANKPGVIKILEEIAADKNSHFFRAEEICGLPETGGHSQLHPENIQTALAAWSLISNENYDSRRVEAAVLNVRSATGLFGRWEERQIGGRRVIFDGAHNLSGLTYVREQLKKYQYKKLHIVLGLSNDRDPYIINLLPADANYYLCSAAVPKAMDISKLQDALAGKNIKYMGSECTSAFRVAIKQSLHHDLILVTGSIFVCGDILSLYEEE